MRSYFIRRLLLIPPTLIGATLIVFAITRLVPGGPVQRAMAAAKLASTDGRSTNSEGAGAGITKEQELQMNRLYLLDQPVLPAYAMWLGVLPREYLQKDVEFEDGEFRKEMRTAGPRDAVVAVRSEDDTGFSIINPDGSENTEWLVRGATEFEYPDEHWHAVVPFADGESDKTFPGPEGKFELKVARLESGEGFVVLNAKGEPHGEWFARPATGAEIETHRVELIEKRAKERKREKDLGKELGDIEEIPAIGEAAYIYPRKARAVIYREKFEGLVTGYLGKSTRYHEPVWDLVLERLPISLYYGVMMLIIIYVTSIPLGVLKAMKHRTWVDNWTSILVFVGYAIPGYALGALLMTYLGFHLGWFPPGGFTSFGYEELGFFGKMGDILYHSVLPLICYVVSGFAFLTLMMKNHLMDNMAADYVRTAVAKGVTFKDAVKRHAFRNSLIPVATNLGHQIGLFLAGSFLIERIFDIDGFGLLGFESLLERDYPVVMGILVLTAVLSMLGNILSDILVALVDPRVRFQ